jgi:hypothetical protein
MPCCQALPSIKSEAAPVERHLMHVRHLHTHIRCLHIGLPCIEQVLPSKTTWNYTKECTECFMLKCRVSHCSNTEMFGT